VKCAFSDGLKVEYNGSLLIKNDNDINIFIKEGMIPFKIKGKLDVAVINYKCSEIKEVAIAVTKSVGKRACIH